MRKFIAVFGVLACLLVLLVDRCEAQPKPGGARIVSKALQGPLRGVTDVLFTTRATYKDPHWYANIGYFCDDENEKARAGDGGPDIGTLCKLNLRDRSVEVLLDARGGSVRDPQVHYDGRKIVFSYRKTDSDYFHLYEIGTDGSRLRQITFGEYDDIEPSYLPDGDLMFVSTRCRRWVQCMRTQVATLFRCNGNGKNIRQISSNVEHDNTPWMLPDGRVMYTRWEYVDRSQVQFHHLWTMNPDGTNQAILFGNMHPGGLFIDAKPIPGTNKILATLSPNHGRKEHAGFASIITPGRGPDDPVSMQPIHPKLVIRDPYPLSDQFFLMAQANKLILMDDSGQTQALYTDKRGYELHEPRPIKSRRREHLVTDRSDANQETGRLLLTDVYQSRNLPGVDKGDIKKLLILETLPKPVNFSGGPDLLSWLGTFTLERVLGTVPVEEDGSAFFELPANRPVLFVALDENDLSVKRMQSFTSVMPGETLGCSGCHEHRTRTPRIGEGTVPLAARRPPSLIQSFQDLPDVMDFHRDIQPILDRHCIDCHSFDKHEGHVSLEGDLGPTFSHSFYALFANRQIADGRNGFGNQPPRSLGSSASALMKKIDGRHHDVTVSPREWRTIWLWIESSAPYVGSYAGLRNAKSQSYSQGGIVFNGQREVLKRRCGECHAVNDATNENGMPLPFQPDFEKRKLNGVFARHERVVIENDPIARFGSGILLNLTRPEKSPLLLGPLSEKAGGWSSCGAIFESAEDPDYRRLLSSIRACKERADTEPRYATVGFKPNPQYIREMKKYGIVPASFDLTRDKMDPFATDHAYWQSFWYAPGNTNQWGPESPIADRPPAAGRKSLIHTP